MINNNAEEVKIVNDSMTCFSQWGDQRGLKNADLFNQSYSLTSVNAKMHIIMSQTVIFVFFLPKYGQK